jgi:hypothetical protein
VTEAAIWGGDVSEGGVSSKTEREAPALPEKAGTPIVGASTKLAEQATAKARGRSLQDRDALPLSIGLPPQTTTLFVVIESRGTEAESGDTFAPRSTSSRNGL